MKKRIIGEWSPWGPIRMVSSAMGQISCVACKKPLLLGFRYLQHRSGPVCSGKCLKSTLNALQAETPGITVSAGASLPCSDEAENRSLRIGRRSGTCTTKGRTNGSF